MAETVPIDPTYAAIGAKAINYSSDQDLSDRRVRGIYLTTGGTLKVDFGDGTSTGLTFSGLVAGTVYPFCITKIYSSGSTGAAGFVLY